MRRWRRATRVSVLQAAAIALLVASGLSAPLAAGVAVAQQRPAPAPAWLETPPSARATTRHLEAEALEPVVSDAGRVLTLRVRVSPRPAMRIYAHDAKGYVPVALTLDLPSRATTDPPVYPASVVYVFPPTGERARVHHAPFTISQRVHMPSGVGSTGRLTATLRYQACDDLLCYAPATARVAWDLPPD